MVFSSSGADMTYLRHRKQWQAMQLLLDDHFLSLCGIEMLEHVHFAAITPDIAKNTVAKHLARVWQPPLKPQSPGCSTNRIDAV